MSHRLHPGRVFVVLAASLAGVLSRADAHDGLPERVAVLTAQLQGRPDDAELLLERGRCLRAAGDLAAAFRDLSRSAELSPRAPGLQLALAALHRDLGWRDSALAHAERARQEAPRDPAALLLAAGLLVECGDLQAAGLRFDTAIEVLGAAAPDVWVTRAAALAARGPDFTLAARAGLDAGLARLGAGTVSLQEAAIELSLRLGDIDDALARLEVLAASARNPHALLLRRGELLRAARRNIEATAAFRDAESARSQAFAAAAGAASGASLSTALLSPALLALGATSPRAALLDPPSQLPAAPHTSVLVPKGATWRFLDDNTVPSAAWTTAGFDDSAWDAGPAQLGYGDGDEATVVSFGPNSSSKYVTTRFRHAFVVADPATYASANLRLLRDDGARVYLNGTEVVRSNLPAGTLTNATKAVLNIGEAGELAYASFTIDPALLVAGGNVLAIEVHQDAVTSSDLSLDAELRASSGPILVRGPWLGNGTSSGVHVRWRTNVATESRAWFGPAPDQLVQTVVDAALVTEHELNISGLAPATPFYYAVGAGSDVLAGGDAGHVFRTAPLTGGTGPQRFWVTGDPGTASATAMSVRDSYVDFAGATPTDAWLMLGDNAYPTGSEEEFQAGVFDTFPAQLANTVLWTARGNHEMSASVYYGSFSLPAAGEAGGVASGTEAYYAFDRGNVHVVCLDSFGSSRAVDGPMHTWLAADLAADTQEWLIAFWHHPPYSKGTHDSDTDSISADMRANFLPLLEQHGVDLVLNGHSHTYERSYLIDGHYGLSAAFGPAFVKDGGDGDVAGDGAYRKVAGAHAGGVYCVTGNAAKAGTGPLDHPVMVRSLSALGSVVLDITGTHLDGTLLLADGSVADHFTLEHEPPGPWTYLGHGLAGTHGVPGLVATGSLLAGSPLTLEVSGALEHASAALVLGLSAINAPFKGGVLVPAPDVLVAGIPLGSIGGFSLPSTFPAGIPAGVSFLLQSWLADPAAPQSFAASNALRGTTP